MPQIQFSGISMFAIADITSPDSSATEIVPDNVAVLPSVEGQRRIAIGFRAKGPNPTDPVYALYVLLDYRDEVFEQASRLAAQQGR